jgi:hypothetical protein
MNRYWRHKHRIKAVNNVRVSNFIYNNTANTGLDIARGIRTFWLSQNQNHLYLQITIDIFINNRNWYG